MRRSQFVWWLTAMLVAASAGAGAAAAQGEDASRLLAQADRFRARWPSVVTDVRIDNYESDRLVESGQFEVATKGESSYIRFLSAKNKGHALLMRGDYMWYFLPSASRPVRITPIQRLLGNASNGDLARLRYSTDYAATLGGQEIVDGVPCLLLELQAKGKGATYQRVRYAIRASDMRPVRAECFLASGKQVKTAFFLEPREMAGETVMTRIAIYDQLKPASRTVMEFLRFTPRDLPDKLFNPVRSDGM
jgi:hypothetical protein